MTKFTSLTIYITTNDDMQLSSRIQLFSTSLLFLNNWFCIIIYLSLHFRSFRLQNIIFRCLGDIENGCHRHKICVLSPRQQNHMCFTWICRWRNFQSKIRLFHVFFRQRFNRQLGTDEYINRFKHLSLNLTCLQGKQGKGQLGFVEWNFIFYSLEALFSPTGTFSAA